MCAIITVKKGVFDVGKLKCLINLVEDDQKIFTNETFFGMKSGNKISYKENDVIVTILVNNNKIMMKRRSADYEIHFQFEEKSNTVGKYFINNSDLWLPLDTFTDKIVVDDSSIRVNYQLKLNEKPQKFLFEIKYEVIE